MNESFSFNLFLKQLLIHANPISTAEVVSLIMILLILFLVYKYNNKRFELILDVCIRFSLFVVH